MRGDEGAFPDPDHSVSMPEPEWSWPGEEAWAEAQQRFVHWDLQ